MKLNKQLVQDKLGNARVSVPVTVYITGSTTRPILYAADDENGDRLGNPLNTDNDGYANFYVADGVYDIIVGTGDDAITYPQVQIYDLDTFKDQTAAAAADAANVAVGSAATAAASIASTTVRQQLSGFTLAQAAEQSFDSAVTGITVSGAETVGDAGAGMPLVYDEDVDAAYVTANPTTSFLDAGGRGYRQARRLAADVDAADGNTVQQNLDTTASRLQQDIYLTDYASLADGDDWTPAIAAAESDAYAAGVSLRIPAGSFGYSADQTFRCEVFGAGAQSTFLVKLAPATITFLKGTIADLTIGPAALIEDDTSHGLVLDGLDRKIVRNVWAVYHGGDGIQYKRGNLSYVHVHCRFNDGHGFYCPAETLTGDNKNLHGFIEATGSGLSGFVIDDSGTSVQTGGQYGCEVTAQGNGTRNVTDDNYDMIVAGTGHNLPNAYQEAGTVSVWAKSTLKMSRLVFGQNGFVDLRLECDKTNSVDRVSAPGVRSTTVENLDELIVRGLPSKVGQLDLYQSADRAWNLDAIGSTAAQTLALGSTLSIKKNGLTHARGLSVRGTLNFGTVTANSSKELTLTASTLTEVVSTTTLVPFCAPQDVTVPTGCSWSPYLSGGTDPVTDPLVFHIRVANATTADVVVPSGHWMAGTVV